MSAGVTSQHTRSLLAFLGRPPAPTFGIVARRAKLGVILVLACLVGCGPKWRAFSSDKGGFSVMMPGEPFYQKKVQRVAGVTVERPTFEVILEHGDQSAGYAVSYVDIPARILRAA